MFNQVWKEWKERQCKPPIEKEAAGGPQDVRKDEEVKKALIESKKETNIVTQQKRGFFG